MGTGQRANSSLNVVDLAPSVECITISRPAKRNALTREMQFELADLIAKERGTRAVVVVSGEGGTFCAGADLAERGQWADSAGAAALLRAPQETDAIVIAAVRGGALGLGFALALACDIVIARTDAFFAFPEIAHGMDPAIARVDLPDAVGQRRAFEILITGRRIGAEEARQIGIASHVFDVEDFDQAVTRLAAAIAVADSTTLRQIKRKHHLVASTNRKRAIDEATGLTKK